jgi:hypothetical protein
MRMRKRNNSIPTGAYLGAFAGALSSVYILLKVGYTPRTPEELVLGITYSTISTLVGGVAGGFCQGALENYFRRKRMGSLEKKLEDDEDGKG